MLFDSPQGPLLHFDTVKKFRAILLALVVILAVVGGVYVGVGYFKPKGAGVLINTNPASSVYIEGQQVGRTPYKETRSPGEVVIKLIPDSFETPLAPHETRVSLVSGIETLIAWDFGETSDLSGGETISFEKLGKGETSLAIISVPDSAQASVDGQIKGFSPYKTNSIDPGEHLLTVSAKGYLDRSVEVKIQDGYKLTAVIQLVQGGGAEEESVVEPVEAESAVKEKKPRVKILPTGTGFLRVRSEPSTLGEEIARVDPGGEYVLINTDEKTGWFEIEYKEGEDGLPAPTGWISNQYAERLDQENSDSEATQSVEDS